jgi:hypothetical protein
LTDAMSSGLLEQSKPSHTHTHIHPPTLSLSLSHTHPSPIKQDLFKLVALNNKILTDAMSSGLLEQSKPAWNFNRLDALWNDLRDEFSIGERFAKVEHKITHVQSNTKFFLEVLNHQKSNKLEWIIIVLIAAEIVLSCIDLYHQILV